jgi:choline kinase
MKVRLATGCRIAEFGKGIALAAAAGESIGIERLDADAATSVFDALRAAGAEGRRDLYYEDIYSELIAEGLDAVAVSVSDLPWSEIDNREDLARAERMVRESEHAL